MKFKTVLSLRYLQNKKKTIMMINDFFFRSTDPYHIYMNIDFTPCK